MLPVDVYWVTSTVAPDTRWLYVGERCVAVVGQRLDGKWNSTVNRHMEPARWRSAISARPETAWKWVERWAIANVGRLRNERGDPLDVLGVPRD